MHEGERYSEEISQEIWNEGYTEGFRDGKDQSDQTAYEDGYKQGYQDGFSEARETGYQDGYDDGYEDGEKTLWDDKGPLDRIIDMEEEVNDALNSPISASFEQTLEMVRNTCQSILRDWGIFVGTNDFSARQGIRETSGRDGRRSYRR